ncbi:MAG: ATP synthase F0 subunit B [Myxococcota bacterium]|nr:ATP synthase F0 subunit B [Myxococcota bacterium]
MRALYVSAALLALFCAPTAALLCAPTSALAQMPEDEGEYLDDSIGEDDGPFHDQGDEGTHVEGVPPIQPAEGLHGDELIQGRGATPGHEVLPHEEGIDHDVLEHGEHGAEHEHHEASFADIDPVAMGGSFVNFALLLVVLWLLMRKSLPEFLSNRRAAVVQGMEEAARVTAEANAKHKEYSERIDNLDAELDRLRDEMRRAGMDERDRIVADAGVRGEKMREEARFLIDQQMKQLREDLTREAIEAAVAAAEAVLVQSTSAQDQERLAKDYLGTIREQVATKAQEKRL